MTFDQIKAAIKGHCNLTSQEADTRVGDTVNRHHRRITAELGLDSTRFVTRTETTTDGVQTVEFEEIEKIDRLIDTTDSSSIRLLREVSVHEQRATQPGTGQPNAWAPQASGSSTVTVLLDTLPQDTYTLQADGWSSLADLQATDSPVFPESFHDILTWYGIAEELLRKEKLSLAMAYETKADKLLAELRHFLIDSHTRDDRQGRQAVSTLTGSGSGGSGTLGATAYTQSALLTFDRGAGAAPFAVAQADAATVTNLDADRLDGEEGAFYLDRANHTGAITSTSLSLSATDRLIGRDTAGSGASEEISVTGGLEFNGAQTLQTSAFTGDVTKAAAGTALTIAADAVTFAKMQNVSAASRLIGRGAAAGSGDPEEIALVTGLEFQTTNLAASGLVGTGTTTAALAANSSSILNSATQPRCAVYHDTTQAINDSTWTALSLNSEEIDVGALHNTGSNTSRMTVPTGGTGAYLVIGVAGFASDATGYRGVRLRKNGTTVVGSATVVGTNPAGDVVVLQCQSVLVLSAADYVEVQAFQTSGGSLNTGSASSREVQNSGYLVKLW